MTYLVFYPRLKPFFLGFTGSYSSYGSQSSSSSGAGGRAMHERSHSDTPTPLPSVALSAESSSVTSLSNLPLRKTVTSGVYHIHNKNYKRS